MVQIFSKLLSRLNRFCDWLWKQKGTPGQRARGLAVGIFCGCFPLFGLQTLLGISFASVLRANHLLAVIGTWISNPVTYLPLYWFNYRVGTLLLGREGNYKGFNEFNLKSIWDQGGILFNKLLLGSFVVGISAGMISGLLVYIFLKNYSKRTNINI